MKLCLKHQRMRSDAANHRITITQFRIEQAGRRRGCPQCEDINRKLKAQGALNRAVKNGTVKRPDVCSKCNQPSPRAIEGHHTDYARPLDVVWLCQPCHRDEHNNHEKEMK